MAGAVMQTENYKIAQIFSTVFMVNLTTMQQQKGQWQKDW